MHVLTEEGSLIVRDRPIESCLFCHRKKPGWFCHLSPGPSAEYDAIGTPIILPMSGILFAEGQISRNVWTICEGRVKLTKTSRSGKTLLVKVAEAGELLGLSAALTNTPYEVTAQAIERTQIKSFQRKDFLHFMQRHAEGSLHAAESLNSEYRTALNDAYRLALSNTIVGRVAHLMLEYAREDVERGNIQPEIHMPLKHEDLASMLGSSRESVTRALNELRRRRIIAIKGTKVTILQREALELLL